jgi:transcription antitermination factor NusG
LEHGGIIGKSRAVREGDRIRVVEGPMKDLNGTITQVNKQRRRATMEFVFDGISRSVTMAFDWVQAQSRRVEMEGR